MISRTWVYTLCVFGFVFTSLALAGIPGWSRLSFAFMGLLFIVSAIDWLKRQGAPGRWMLLPLLFFFVAVVDGLVRYPDSHDAIIRLVGAWVGCSLVGDAVRRGLPISVAINAMLLASVANGVAALVGFDAFATYAATAEQQAFTSILDRRTGLVGNANLLAVQAVMPLFAVLIWGRGLSKVFVMLGIACAIYAVFSTGSRKLLVLLLFLLAAGLMRLPLAKRWIAVFVGGTLAVAGVLLVWAGGMAGGVEVGAREVLAIDRIYVLLEGRDNSYFIRDWMIDIAQGMFLERPIQGWGLGYFAAAAGFGGYAHNNYWELAVSGGVVLIGCYYAMHVSSFLRAIRKALKGYPESGAACILILAVLVNDYGMVTYDEEIIVLMLVLLLVGSRTGMTNLSLSSRDGGLDATGRRVMR
jgi:hypothetical protein